MDKASAHPSHRPRLRQLWRWGRCVILLFAVLVAVHFGWIKLEERRLRRMVEEFRRAGEPMLPEDFDQTPIPDSDNAVVDLRAAAASIDDDDPRFKAILRLDNAIPLTEHETAIIKAAVDANRTALEKADAATRKRGVYWGLKLRTPVIDTPLPDLNRQRNLCQLLMADALYAHQTGDDGRAVHRLTQIAFVSRAMDEQPLLLSHLVSLGFSEFATTQANQIAPELNIGPATKNDDSGPASPDLVEYLVRALVDQDRDSAAAMRAMRCERFGGFRQHHRRFRRAHYRLTSFFA